MKITVNEADDMAKILDRVSRCFGVPVTSLLYLVLIDMNGKDKSLPITSAEMFWQAYNGLFRTLPGAKFSAALKSCGAVDANNFDVKLVLSKDCQALCPHNTTRNVSFPLGANWETISSVFSDAYELPKCSVEYFLILDADGDEISSLLNTPDKFWRAVSTFQQDKGDSIYVYLDDTTFGTVKSYVDRQQFLLHSENFSIELDCDHGTRAELFMSAGSSWNQIKDEVIMTLGLTATTTLKQMVLQDGDRCSISAPITSDSKFWKMFNLKYKQTPGARFVITVSSPERQNQFFEACSRTDMATSLFAIIKQGVDVNAICDESSVAGADVAELRSGIHIAIVNANISAVRLLCALNCLELNRPDAYGMTPLHHACNSGNLDQIVLLFEKGAQFKGHNTLGKTALHALAERGIENCRNMNLKLINLLNGDGAKRISPGVLNAFDNSFLTPLMAACKREDLSIVKGFVDAGALVNVRDSNGMSPFLYAVLNGSLIVARYLIDQGANISARNNAGEDAFMMCAITGNLKVAEFLLGMQLDIDTRNHQGQSLHEVAVACGNVAVADWFASNGSGKNSLSVKALKHLVETDMSLERRLRSDECSTYESVVGVHPPAFDGSSVAANSIRVVMASEPVPLNSVVKAPKKVKSIANDDKPVVEKKTKSIASDDKVEDPATTSCKPTKPVTVVSEQSPSNTQIGDPVAIDNNFSKSSEENRSPLSSPELPLSSTSSSPICDYDFDGLDGKGIYNICNSGNKDKLRKMIEKGVNLDAIDQDGSDYTALHGASEKGNLKVAQILLSNGCNPNPFSFDGETPLYLACSHGHVAIAKLLVEKGVSVTNRIKDTTLLHVAASNMHLDMVTWLVKQQHFPIDALNDTGFSALHETCRVNDSLMARLLVNLGSPVEAHNNSAPLHVSCFMGHLELSKWLVSKGANPNTMYRGKNCFLMACCGGQLSVASWLDSIGADIFCNDTNDGRSPLHSACVAESKELCDWLLKKNIRYLSLRDNCDESAYCLALRSRDSDLLTLLEGYLQKGVSLSVYEEALRDETVDMLAKTIAEKNFDVSKFILQRLMNIVSHDYVCSDGCTPIHFAAAVGNVALINYLINKGALVDSKSSDDKAPIHYAAITGSIETGMCLAEAGADLLCKDKDGRDAEMYAKHHKHKAFLKWFKKHPNVVKARAPPTSFFSLFTCVSTAEKDDESDDSDSKGELFASIGH